MLLENLYLYEIQDQTKQVNLFGQPRFNTSCDLESLQAANECEARVLNSGIKFSEISHLRIWIDSIKELSI